jgi:hypothetical protein
MLIAFGRAGPVERHFGHEFVRRGRALVGFGGNARILHDANLTRSWVRISCFRRRHADIN